MTTNRAASMRYAQALLEVSQKEGCLERVEKEVAEFLDLMAAHKSLGNSLVNPSVPRASKRGLMTELMTKLGDLSPVTRRLLMLLADRDRLSLLEEILALYRDKLMEHRGILRARVTTASDLSPERVEAISRQLESTTGKKVEVVVGVDSALLGGMVTQIGSTVYDGSVAGHLDRLRRLFLTKA